MHVTNDDIYIYNMCVFIREYTSSPYIGLRGFLNDGRQRIAQNQKLIPELKLISASSLLPDWLFVLQKDFK